MSGLTVEQVNDLCDAIKTAYTTLGSKIADPDMKAAYAKMPPLIDSLRDLAKLREQVRDVYATAADPLALDLASTLNNVGTELEQLRAECERLRRDAELKQAKVDSLMLEYCPDEMSQEQLENWKHHQRKATPEETAAIDAASADGEQ